jgi:outer membrane biosynthesis protein TonB
MSLVGSLMTVSCRQASGVALFDCRRANRAKPSTTYRATLQSMLLPLVAKTRDQVVDNHGIVGDNRGTRRLHIQSSWFKNPETRRSRTCACHRAWIRSGIAALGREALDFDAWSARRERMAMIDIAEAKQVDCADAPLASRYRTRMGTGFIGSFALHGLVLVLVALSWEAQAPPQRISVVAVNLVRLSDRTTSPPSPQTASIPQDKATTVPQSEPAQIVLAPIVEPLPQPVTPIQPSAPQSEASQKPKQKTNSPSTAVTSASRPTTTTAHTHRLSPNEQLAARLKLLAGLRQTVPPKSNNARQQDGTGISNITAATADTIPGRYATYAVRDLIRAQVERRWNLDRTQLGARDWVVAIRITFSPDGTVQRAHIVNNERLRSDSAYHDFALSARNAVLLSSPLTLPPGTYGFTTEVVVDFASRQVLQ